MQSSTLHRLLLNLTGALPLTALYTLTGGLSSLVHLRRSKARKNTETNLALCFPDITAGSREKMIRSSLRHDAYALAEIAPFYTWSAQKLNQVVDEPDTAILQSALSEGKGTLLCAPHFGAWELLGQYLSQRHAMHVLYKPSRHTAVDNVLLPGRTRFGLSLHPTTASGVRGLHKALTDNGIVSILPDQEPDAAGGEFAPFFGQPALTMTLLTRLARKKRVPVLLTAAIRNTGERRFQIVYERLGDDIYNSDATIALACMNAAIERLARSHPEQYLWSYRRFRSLPSGERRSYK